MKPIVGIGELLWDIFPDGRKVAGGAPFNFAFHCQQLGHDAVIVSRVGNDDLGRELREEVRRLGLSDEYIQTDYTHPTGTVRVTLDAGQPSYEIVENVAWDCLMGGNKLTELVKTCEAVCFGTLGQRSVESRETIRKLTGDIRKIAAVSPLRVLDLNVRPPFFHWAEMEDSLKRCDWLKLNEDELFRLVDLVPLAHFDETSPAHELRLEYDLNLVCLSRGSQGAFLAVKDDEIIEPAPPASIVDTVGAGDAFTAAMVCLHLEGKSLRECARFATHYAARVCEHRGATPRIDRAEIELAAFGR